MHGSIRLVNAEVPKAANMENSTMMGVGITPEGIHQNYVVYEFALEKAWQYEEIDHKQWVRRYSNVRYGFSSKLIEQAWLLLLKSVYAFESQTNIRGKYTYCRRPTLKFLPWKWYDEKHVRKALEKFVTIANDETVPLNNLFRRDLIDLTRQFLQNQADTLYLNIVSAFKRKTNWKQFNLMTENFLDLLNDLDSLLGTHNDFLLGNFLEGAKALAKTDDERKQYEFNARNQITLWGDDGEILDYATKQWNGIVKDYYLPRWTLFFQQLTNSLENNVTFHQWQFQEDVFKEVEYPFNTANKIYPTQAQGELHIYINSILF